VGRGVAPVIPFRYSSSRTNGSAKGPSSTVTSMLIHRSIRSVRICDPDGLHLRAASLLSQYAERFPCEIRVTCGDHQANAKSVWELIGLVAEAGCELVLEATDPQSEAALDQLVDLVAHGFQVSTIEDCHESV
jgi:phosphotransferase system HPr (HPr) family protein